MPRQPQKPKLKQRYFDVFLVLIIYLQDFYNCFVQELFFGLLWKVKGSTHFEQMGKMYAEKPGWLPTAFRELRELKSCSIFQLPYVAIKLWTSQAVTTVQY